MKRLSRDSFCPQEAPTTRAQDSSPTSTSTRTRAAPAREDRRHHPRRAGRSGPKGLGRSRRLSTARPPASFRRGEEFRGGRPPRVEGWPPIGPSLGPQRCKSDEPERSHRTQRREKESRETGPCFRFDVGLARFRSVAFVAHRGFPLRGCSERWFSGRARLPPSRHLGKSGLGGSLALPLWEQTLNNHSIILNKIGDPRRTPRIAQV